MNTAKWRFAACLVALVLFPVPSHAQEPESVPDAAQPAKDDTTDRLNALNEKVATIERQMAAVEQRAAQQEKETAAVKGELAETRQQQEDLMLSVAELSTAEEEGRLRIFGFMDTSFTASFPEKRGGSFKWDTPVFALTPRRNTFYMANVNLFFKSEMTRTLEALVETRFTFQPNGNVKEYPIARYMEDSDGNVVLISTDASWDRTDTTVSNAYTGDFRLGGVVMERAQFDWKPVDWLNIRVGRWLTPYGIWNEDHGATVLISATQPFLVKHAFVPGAQTGLVVSGRGFPTDLLTLDYALTVSNGRGPMDEFYDLDSNKALGFRGRVALRIGEADLSAGTYVYYGKYTDTTNRMEVYMNSTFSGFAEGMDDPVRYVETTTRQYREAVIAADLRLSFKGVSLFGEFVRGRVEYLKASGIDPIRPLMIGSSPTIPAAEANYIKQAGYVLGAWELPLSKFIGAVKIIPFAGVDFLSPHDVYDYDSLHMIQFGVNVKPAAYVSLKSNAYCVVPTGDTPIISTVWYWTNQLAVSF